MFILAVNQSFVYLYVLCDVMCCVVCIPLKVLRGGFLCMLFVFYGFIFAPFCLLLQHLI